MLPCGVVENSGKTRRGDPCGRPPMPAASGKSPLCGTGRFMNRPYSIDMLGGGRKSRPYAENAAGMREIPGKRVGATLAVAHRCRWHRENRRVAAAILESPLRFLHARGRPREPPLRGKCGGHAGNSGKTRRGDPCGRPPSIVSWTQDRAAARAAPTRWWGAMDRKNIDTRILSTLLQNFVESGEKLKSKL